MTTAKYRRIVLKLSGEALSGEQGNGIDPKVIQSVAEQVKEVAELGVEVAVVVGGEISGEVKSEVKWGWIVHQQTIWECWQQ